MSAEVIPFAKKQPRARGETLQERAERLLGKSRQQRPPEPPEAA
jgi:hypothetical protein